MLSLTQPQFPVHNQGLAQPQIQVQAANPFQIQANPIFNPMPTQQVFQADQTAVLTVLQQMMEEMRSWRNPASSHVQPLLRPQIYSQGSQAPQLGWGSPSIQNESQFQSQSQ